LNRSIAKYVSLFAVSFLILFLFACRTTRRSQPDHPRKAIGVEMQDVVFYSTALSRTMPYRVYLPATRSAGEKFPVIYLLHGGGADYRSWSEESDVAHYALTGLILVMPDGDESYYMNEVESPRNRFEDYITHDLIADVEQRFPARNDREGRAVIGISMGGFAAVDYAFMHPALFIFVGALSPSIDVPFRHFNLRRIGQWWKFRNIFGPTGSQERSDRNPFQLVRTANPKQTPYIYLTAGSEEPLLEPNRRFVAQLHRHGFAYEFHTKPGGHDWGEWNAQIPGCFAALSRFIPKDNEDSASSSASPGYATPLIAAR
jgi:putative tributyrin esterase